MISPDLTKVIADVGEKYFSENNTAENDFALENVLNDILGRSPKQEVPITDNPPYHISWVSFPEKEDFKVCARDSVPCTDSQKERMLNAFTKNYSKIDLFRDLRRQEIEIIKMRVELLQEIKIDFRGFALGMKDTNPELLI